jgi:hypothetical protein
VSDTPRDARFGVAGPELPLELSELLRAGREPLGTPEEVGELGRRLSALLGPAAGLPDGGGPPAGPGPSGGTAAPGAAPSATPALGVASRGLWALGSLGAVVTVGVAAFVLLRGPSDPVSAPSPSAAPAAAPQAAPPAAPEPAKAAPAPSDAAPPPADADSEPGSEAVLDESPPHPSAARTPHRAAPRRARSDAARETALLEPARAALQSDPAEALKLTRRHRARFPRGALAQEREVIAIEALERLGRKAAARARAAEFERRYRGSVHQPRLLREADTSAPAGGRSSTTVP